MRQLLTATFLFTAASGAHAQDVSKCLTMHDNLERWSCYDDEAGYTKPEVDEPEPEERVVIDYGKSDNWRVNSRVSDFEDTTDVFMSVDSESPVTCSMFGSHQPATLLVRCMENTTSMIIQTNCHLASGFHGYGEVDMRIDDEPAFTRQFDESTDNRGLGLWSGGASIPTIKRLFDKQILRVRFTPFNQSPVSAEFDVSGLADQIGPLRESCSW